ncbi:unnamed protein product [Microthlaspi erraticum]|uniref:Reverse transcriptase zinc-binding domain-containing protein n=1 Tax=Microthlaspi erraticum TaxID=1685480 RepID=A0A6D2LDB8_9BRAS|nr:unnamed protein product [Microthlaspi erraticum]
MLNAFLWNGESDSARGARVSWEAVCSPKKSGGLGLRRIAHINQVFGLKLIWMLFAEQGSLWVAWVRHNIIQRRNFWTFDFRGIGSWIWRRLVKLRHLARPLLVCQISSGNSALFWHDNWTTLGPLIDITGANGPRVTGIQSMATVSQAVEDETWLLPRGRHPLLILLRNCLPSPPLRSNASHSDKFLWINSPTSPPGKFSTAATWKSLHPSSDTVSWYYSVWFKNNIPKHAFMLWLAVQNRLFTRDRLCSWGLSVPDICLLCNSAAESRDHLFFVCPYSDVVWRDFFNHHSLSPPVSFTDIISWVSAPFSSSGVKIICSLIFQAVVYFIWMERNLRLHSTSTKSSHTLVKEIKLLLRAKLAALDRQIRSLA